MTTVMSAWNYAGRFLKAATKKSRTEALLCALLLAFVPVYYCVDVFHILPYACRERWSFCYFAHALPLTFIVFNVMTNFVAVIFVDSSVMGRSLTVSEHATKSDVRTFCNVCQCTVPPRCWHCDICDVCVLTRDHHCTFSMTCVGHFNRRYFLWFLMYFSVASLYEITLVGYYVYSEVTIQFSDLIAVLIPIQLIVVGFHLTVGQIFVLLTTLNLVAVSMSTLLLVYHLGKVRRGLVCHEKPDNSYNSGLIRNLETVFGEKWYITWISPFIESKLPHNGFDWQNHISQYKLA